ncbi:MAG TPA: hypothetical protein VFW96_29425 [Thermomicrobiales bacterium]|nr:hypothetical protein [Thermomicrobiales bacterium]
MVRPSRLALTRAFHEDQARLGAYNQRRLGLREVPLAAIAGTVGRPALRDRRRLAAWRRTPRYQDILAAVAEGRPLPPVELYLLDGHYYIRDGHHRVLAARELGALEVDAEVTEFLPTEHSPAAAWHRARAAFERDTGLVDLHVRRAEGYEGLRRQIAEYCRRLGERGCPSWAFRDAAAAWEREVYRSALAALGQRGVPERAPDLTAAELYLAASEHKGRGERRGCGADLAAAAADYTRRRRHPRLAALAARLAALHAAPARGARACAEW